MTCPLIQTPVLLRRMFLPHCHTFTGLESRRLSRPQSFVGFGRGRQEAWPAFMVVLGIVQALEHFRWSVTDHRRHQTYADLEIQPVAQPIIAFCFAKHKGQFQTWTDCNALQRSASVVSGVQSEGGMSPNSRVKDRKIAVALER